MIKATTQDQQKVVKKPFPKLMISEDGDNKLIVLVTRQRLDCLSGTVIVSSKGWRVGDCMAHGFLAKSFTDYDGVVTLQNE